MGDSVFWGLIVEPGKPSAYVPPPEDARLHISQAVLDPAAEDGARVWLRCKVQDGPSLAVAALRCGGSEAQALDLILDQYSEFTVEGPAPVHVTGYFIPVEEEYEEHDHGDDEDDEDEEEDDEEALAHQFGLPRGMTLDQMRQMYADGDLDLDGEDDDEDDEDDDEDDAEPPMFGGAAPVMDDIDNDDDDDDDEETSEYDSEDEVGARFKSEVVIEELDPQPPEAVAKAAGQKRKADLAAMDEPKSAKRPAAQVKAEQGPSAAKPKNGQKTPAGNGAAGAAAMDEDDDEDDDEEDEDDEEEDEEEEDEDEAMPQEQQQRTRQQSKQKLPSVAKALDDAAATALASGKKQQQQQQQQPSTQKKGKNKQQAEANGLDTPEATAAGATAKTPASGGRKSVRRFENGFVIEDVAIGQPDGKLAKGGKRVQMKYVGRLASNGKVFDQTKGSKPFTFRLGVGEVIKGWDRGVEGMRVGDRRKLTIPPSMAYGTKGAPPDIPPNAKLVFDVELVNVL